MQIQKNINILGFGVMGRQIAALFSVLGYSVHVWTRNHDPERAKRFQVDLKIIRRGLQEYCKEVEVLELKFVDEIANLPHTLTIEALVEDINVKKDIISRLPFSIDEYSVFTNSSSIPASEIGYDIGAMHFFNPISAVKIIELYLPNEKSENILEFLDPLVKAGYLIVPVQSNTGMIGNFLLFSYISEFLFLIENKKYSVEQITAVMGRLNFSINPLEIINIVGVDVVLDIINNLKNDRPGIYVPISLSKAIDEGVLGKKNKTCFAKFLTSFNN